MAPKPPPLSSTPLGPPTLSQFTIDVEGEKDFKKLVDLGGKLGEIVEKTVRDSTAWSNVLRRTGGDISKITSYLGGMEKASLHINAIQRDTVKNYQEAQKRVRSLQAEIENLYKKSGRDVSIFAKEMARLGLASELDKAREKAENLKKTFDSMDIGRFGGLIKAAFSHLPVVGGRLAAGVVPRAQGLGGILPFTGGTLAMSGLAAAGTFANAFVKAGNEIRRISSSFSVLVDYSEDVRKTLAGLSWTGQMSLNESVGFVKELQDAGLKIDEIRNHGEDFLKTQIATGVALSQQLSLYNLVVRQTRSASESVGDASRYAHVMIRQAAVLGQHLRNVDIDTLLKGAEAMKTQTGGLVTDAKELVNQFSLLTSAAGLAALGLQKSKFLTQDMVKGIADGALGLQGASFEAKMLSHYLAFPGQSMSDRFAEMGRMSTGEDQAMDSLTGSTDTLQRKVQQSLGPAIRLMGMALGSDLGEIRRLREQGQFGKADKMLYAKEAMVGDYLKANVPAFQGMNSQSAALLTHTINQKMVESGQTPMQFMKSFFSGGAKSPMNAMMDELAASGEITKEVADAIKKADTRSIQEKMSENVQNIANWTQGILAATNTLAAGAILGARGRVKSLLPGGASEQEAKRIETLTQKFANEGKSATEAEAAAVARVRKEREYGDLFALRNSKGEVVRRNFDDTDLDVLTDEGLQAAIDRRKAEKAALHENAKKARAKKTAAQTAADATVAAASTALSGKWARARGLPENLVEALVSTESSGKTDAESIVNGKSYVGLMQVGQEAWDEMLKDPETAGYLAQAYPGKDIRSLGRKDPEANMIVGTGYLKRMLGKANSKESAPLVKAIQNTLGLSENDAKTYLGLTYYNAGPGRFNKQLSSEKVQALLQDPSQGGMERLLSTIQIGDNKKGTPSISLLEYLLSNHPAQILGKLGRAPHDATAGIVGDGPPVTPNVSVLGGTMLTPKGNYDLSATVTVSGTYVSKGTQQSVADVAGQRGSGQGAPAQ